MKISTKIYLGFLVVILLLWVVSIGSIRSDIISYDIFKKVKNSVSLSDGDQKYAVELERLEDEVDLSYASGLRLTIVIGGLATLLAAIIAYFLTRSIVGPINKLTRAAADLGNGKFETAINIDTKRGALADLAMSFNKMARELESYSRDLEEKVAERTRRLEDSGRVMLSVLEDTVEIKEKLEKTLKVLSKKEQELIQAGKLSGIGQMAAGVAHEINNPLTCIMGFSQLMLSDKDLPQNLKEDLLTIERESKRCVGIIERLLDFARPQIIQKEPADINQIIDSTLKIVQYSLKMERVELTLDLKNDLPKIFCDPHQLQEVFMNMIVNALHAMPEGGSMKVGTNIVAREGNDFIEVTISDTGVGISAEIKDKIFDPFFTTAYETRAKAWKGTGLGLSIAYSIIADHGGVIEVESEVGKGTTFRVLLPIYKKEKLEV